MTEKEEGNTLIAEFVGMKVYYKGGRIPWIEFPYMTDAPVSQYCRYHNDWNKLMPVVDKIEAMGFRVLISTTSVTISVTNKMSHIVFRDYMQINIDVEMCKSKIEAVWLAVVQFIKLYNTQSK